MIFMAIAGWPLRFFLRDLGKRLYVAVTEIYPIFQFIWTIIGAVVLWRDSLVCKTLENNSFWSAASAVVIVSIILIVIGGFTLQHRRK